MIAARLALVLWLTSSSVEAAPAIEGPVAASVERVVDGDTVRVTARIWVGHSVSVSVRLAGVDAPELYRPRCPAERDLARRAKAFVEAMLTGGEVVLHDIVNDKYGGRVVARLLTADGADVGDALLEEGLAIDEHAEKAWCE
ncbi:MAG: thermonuclease family protein [Parvularculaceae bacterium]|nr:thermonuclease family protein [Parvularculaceae bacterium]